MTTDPLKRFEPSISRDKDGEADKHFKESMAAFARQVGERTAQKISADPKSAAETRRRALKAATAARRRRLMWFAGAGAGSIAVAGAIVAFAMMPENETPRPPTASAQAMPAAPAPTREAAVVPPQQAPESTPQASTPTIAIPSVASPPVASPPVAHVDTASGAPIVPKPVPVDTAAAAPPPPSRTVTETAPQSGSKAAPVETAVAVTSNALSQPPQKPVEVAVASPNVPAPNVPTPRVPPPVTRQELAPPKPLVPSAMESASAADRALPPPQARLEPVAPPSQDLKPTMPPEMPKLPVATPLTPEAMMSASAADRAAPPAQAENQPKDQQAPAVATAAVTQKLPSLPAGKSADTSPSPDTTPAVARPANHDQIREAQAMLSRFGFNPGPVDGNAGAMTRGAIMRYQESRGIPETGTIDEAFLDQLHGDPAPQTDPMPLPPLRPPSRAATTGTDHSAPPPPPQYASQDHENDSYAPQYYRPTPQSWGPAPSPSFDQQQPYQPQQHYQTSYPQQQYQSPSDSPMASSIRAAGAKITQWLSSIGN